MSNTPLRRFKWVESDTWVLNALGVFLVFRARMASKINGL